MNSSSIKCLTCGHVFSEDEPKMPCPKCGCKSRAVDEYIEEHMPTFDGFRFQQRRLGHSGWLVDMLNRIKKSLHGRLARESLVIDRTDTNKTVKTHHVKELQPDGKWKDVHDHTDEFDAKRRPKSRPSS